MRPTARFHRAGRCLRRFAARIALVTYLIGFAPPTGAAALAPHGAGLVVDYGDGRVTYAYVPFAEEELTGIELLRRSGVPLVTVSFGGLGEAVCSVDGTGCGVGECRRRVCQTADRSSPFWQYARLTPEGEWQPFALGASQSTVRDGDIDGWAWTGTEPLLPVITMDELIERAGGLKLAARGNGEVPSPAVRTVGGEEVAGREGSGLDQVLLGSGLLIAVGALGGFALWWVRRAARSAGL